MKERIDIIIPDSEIERNPERQALLGATERFEPTERVPVFGHPNQWTALAARGVSAGEYVRSPRDNLRHQILNLRWQIECIHDDRPIPTKGFSITPDLGCLRGVEFPMDITWQEDQPPKCTHPLTSVEQIDTLQVPPPDGALNATRIAWWREMRDLKDEFDVRLNGERLQIDVTIGQPGGPIPGAFALAGSNLFLWIALDPERVHRLMEIVTESHLQCIAFFDELAGRSSTHPVGLGADTSELMSARAFREFVVPYHLRIWSRYPGRRGLHNCGRIDHILDALRDDLQITHLNGFGFPADPDLLGQELGGRVHMVGGPSPVLLKEGPYEAIVAECERYIRTVGRHGGYVLMTGGGDLPGTPLAHYPAMMEASHRAGCPMEVN